MRWILATLTLCSLGAIHPSADGSEGSLPEIVGVRVGIGGQYKAGLWTPVEVLLRGGGEPWSGHVAAITPDGDGAPCRFTSPTEPACSIAPGESKSVSLYARFGRTEPALTVQLLEAAGAVQVQRVFRAGTVEAPSVFSRALRSTEGLIVVVGPETLAVEETFAGVRQLAGGRTVPVRLSDAAQLPSRWCGYEGADMVVLVTSDAKTYAGLRSDSPQVLALEQWIRMGGAMLLCAGRNAETLLGADAPLSRFAPGRLARMIPLWNTGAVESYCNSSVQIPREGFARQAGLRAPQWADVDGVVEAREGNLPLIVRRTLGFGGVVFVALDLDLPPLTAWPDRGLLWGRLLGAEDTPPDTSRAGGAVLHYGFDDMAGQLRSALDQFAEVPVIPFWVVVALVAVYLALIGPGDYFFLHKIARRTTLTWVTFPLIVTAFCVGAYVLAHRIKGDRMRVNQVDVVDVDTATNQVRGTSWATVFSPRAQRNSLGFEPQRWDAQGGSEAEVMTCWLGLPGESLGGMDPKTATPTVWRETYDCLTRPDLLAGVPLPTWSTKSLTARWNGKTPAHLEVRISEEDRVPVGTVTNTLGFPLSECLLCYGRWAYLLGDLSPGESAQVGPTTERRDLNTLLTGRRLLFEEGVQRATPYDRGSVDLMYIVRAMMFFKAAGGYRYTGLVHRHQGFIDLSDLLKANRAILVATGPGESQGARPGARLVSDGRALADPQDRHLTVYRFVMPVGKSEQ